MGQKVIYYPGYWRGKKLAYPEVPAEASKFSRSVVVGNLIFVSGCHGANDATLEVETNIFEEQMVVALDKVREAMEGAGSSMDNVVKTLLLVKNRGDYPRMRRTELEYYRKYAPFLVDSPPASTVVVPVSLVTPPILVEIDVVGVIDREAPGWEAKYYPEYRAGKKLAYPHVPPESGKYARTEVVGNLIFVSGCTGMNSRTARVETDVFSEQMIVALDKVREALEETGSSMDRIVKTMILLRNLDDYPCMRQTELEYYQRHASFLVDNPPASTVIQVASLAWTEFLIEIDVIAVL